MEEKSYFYIDASNAQQGPITIAAMRERGILTPDTMLWCAGMDNWVKASTLVNDFSGANIPPVPPRFTHVDNGSNYSSYNSREQQEYNRCNDEPMPKTWLVESILTTIFCCLVTGIIGLVYANKVETLWLRGDREGSRSASKTARTMFWLSVIFACSWVIIYIIYIIIVGAAFLSF